MLLESGVPFSYRRDGHLVLRCFLYKFMLTHQQQQQRRPCFPCLIIIRNYQDLGCDHLPALRKLSVITQKT